MPILLMSLFSGTWKFTATEMLPVVSGIPLASVRHDYQVLNLAERAGKEHMGWSLQARVIASPNTSQGSTLLPKFQHSVGMVNPLHLGFG